MKLFKHFSHAVFFKIFFWIILLGFISVDAYFLLSNLKTNSLITSDSSQKIDFRVPIENPLIERYVYFRNFTNAPLPTTNIEHFVGPIIGTEFEFFDISFHGESKENYILFQIVDSFKKPLDNLILPGNFLMLDLGAFPLITHDRILPKLIYFKVEEHNFNQDEPAATLDSLFIHFLENRTTYENCKEGNPISIATNKSLKQTKKIMSAYDFGTYLFQHKNKNGYQVFTPIYCQDHDMETYMRNLEYNYREGVAVPRSLYYDKVDPQDELPLTLHDTMAWYIRKH